MPEDSKGIFKDRIIEKVYRSTHNRGNLQSLQEYIIKKFLIMITIFSQTICQILQIEMIVI